MLSNFLCKGFKIEKLVDLIELFKLFGIVVIVLRFGLIVEIRILLGLSICCVCEGVFVFKID